MGNCVVDASAIYNITKDIDCLNLQLANEQLLNQQLKKSMTGLKIFCAVNVVATIVLGIELLLFEKTMQEEKAFTE